MTQTWPWFSLILATVITLTGCSSKLEPVDKPESYSQNIVIKDSAVLKQYSQQATQGQGTNSGLYPLSNGEEAFVSRLSLIAAAQHSIDLQYYIYRLDDTGKLLSWYLLKAADRGVRVRLLLDDMTTGPHEKALAALATHPNIDVRLFNPFYHRNSRWLEMIGAFERTNRRMHNKSLIVDNHFSVVGGRNIGNEYFSADLTVDFGDLDLLTIGPVVHETALQFDLYWNDDFAIPVEHLVSKPDGEPFLDSQQEVDKEAQAMFDSEYFHRLKQNTLLQQIKTKQIPWVWAPASLYYDNPEKLQQSSDQQIDNLASQLSTWGEQANQEMVLISPYFVPTQYGVDRLIKLKQEQQVDIVILTNSLASTDVVAVHSGYQGYRKPLLAAGIKLFEVKANPDKKPGMWSGSSRSSLHAKTFILDRHAIFIGSMNYDPRSVWLNTEMGIVVESPELAQSLLASKEESLSRSAYQVKLAEDGQLVWFDAASNRYYQNEPDAGFWRRFVASFLSFLPLEEQL